MSKSNPQSELKKIVSDIDAYLNGLTKTVGSSSFNLPTSVTISTDKIQGLEEHLFNLSAVELTWKAVSPKEWGVFVCFEHKLDGLKEIYLPYLPWPAKIILAPHVPLLMAQVEKRLQSLSDQYKKK